MFRADSDKREVCRAISRQRGTVGQPVLGRSRRKRRYNCLRAAYTRCPAEYWWPSANQTLICQPPPKASTNSANRDAHLLRDFSLRDAALKPNGSQRDSHNPVVSLKNQRGIFFSFFQHRWAVVRRRKLLPEATGSRQEPNLGPTGTSLYRLLGVPQAGPARFTLYQRPGHPGAGKHWRSPARWSPPAGARR